MAALTQHTLKVLLIDDQRMIGEAVRRMLVSEADIQFRYCQDPRQALAIAAEFEPTVILQDLVMPGVDGLDLVRDFRNLPATKAVPLIVLSTQEEPEVKVRAFGLGANDYLVKLPDRLELLARIRYHSGAYISLLQRDEAYRALVESQRQLQRHSAFIRQTFGRYLSDEVVASLLETPEGLSLGGEERLVTIMMADLRGFTQLSEGLPADKVVAMLNNFLEEMTDVIFHYEGTIDEFIGDAILAIFPVSAGPGEGMTAACARALAAVADVRANLERLNRERAGRGEAALGLGIALHQGEVSYGNIGAQNRLDFTVIGAVVNEACRVEAMTRTLGVDVLLTESFVRVAELPADAVVPLGAHRLKGVSGAVELYGLPKAGAR